MKTTIDSAGRVAIPKELRVELGLTDGQVVDVHEREGRIEIEPVPVGMTLRDDGRGLAAHPDEELPPLTDEIARETLESVRR